MTIAEVAKRYGISADTLRYYEKIGLIPHIGRNKSGIRDYTEEDCHWIEFIRCMRGAGLPIEALTRYIELFQQGEETAEERKLILIDEKAKLEKRISELNDTLDRLNFKIAQYNKPKL